MFQCERYNELRSSVLSGRINKTMNSISLTIFLLCCGLADVANGVKYTPLRVITKNDEITALAIPNNKTSNGYGFLPPVGLEYKVKNACPSSDSSTDVLRIVDSQTCSKKIKPTIKKSDSCPFGFDAYNIGFEIHTKNSNNPFFRLVKICFNSDVGTLFTRHRVPIVEPPTTSSLNFNWFHSTDFDQGWEIGNAYDPSNQRNHFKKILDKEMHPDAYLVPQRLARSDDLYLDEWKSCTYYYSNIAPIWNTIAQTWNEIINSLIKIVYENCYKTKSITIMSGTHGIYNYKKESQEEIPLYLENNGKKFYVPLYHWKMFRITLYDGEKEGLRKRNILVIIHNTLEKEDQKKLCRTSVCKEAKWSTKVEEYNSDTVTAYCCFATDELLEILGIKGYEFNTEDEPTSDTNPVENPSDAVSSTNKDGKEPQNETDKDWEMV